MARGGALGGMAQRKLWVAVEGNIGAGKSTLVAALQRRAAAAAAGGAQDVLVLQEPVGEWTAPLAALSEDGDGQPRSMLQAFYESTNPDRHAFAFQMYVLLSRLRQGRHADAKAVRAVVSERSVDSSVHVFGRAMRASGELDAMQLAVLTSWADEARELGLGPPELDLVVYLRVLPETCAARTARRARPGEQAVTPGRLSRLHDAHDRWADELRAAGRRVLVLDGSAEGMEAVEAMADEVMAAVEAAADDVGGVARQ